MSELVTPVVTETSRISSPIATETRAVQTQSVSIPSRTISLKTIPDLPQAVEPGTRQDDLKEEPKEEITTASPTTETPTEPIQAIKEEMPLSKRMAILSRKEREVFEQTQKIKQERETLEQERSQIAPFLEAFKAFKTNSGEDSAFAFLDQLAKYTGIPDFHDKLIDRMTPSYKDPATEKQESVQDLIDKRFKEEEEKRNKASQSAKDQQIVSDLRKSIEEKVHSAGEQYPFMNKTEWALDFTWERIVEYVNQYSSLPDIEQTLGAVETYLQDEWKASKARYEVSTNPDPKVTNTQTKVDPKQSTTVKVATERPQEEVPKSYDVRSKDAMLRKMMKDLNNLT